VILKELDLRKGKQDQILFHGLYRDEETREVRCHSADGYLDIHPNAIADAFSERR